jgi:hypothetical protein
MVGAAPPPIPAAAPARAPAQPELAEPTALARARAQPEPAEPAATPTEAAAEPAAMPAETAPTAPSTPAGPGPPAAAAAEVPSGDAGPVPGPPAAAVELHMPAPPTGPSRATVRRIRGVQSRAAGAAVAHGKLPEGAEQVGDAQNAVTPPKAEAVAKAQAALIAQVQAAPSPEIVKLTERIKEVIRKKRPPDEDALMEAEPDGEALSAGNELNSSIDGETKRVQGNYGAMNSPPAAPAPAKGQQLPPQPDAAGTAPVHAQAATPDAVPAADVSLDADAAASKKRAHDAGMDTPAAQEVQSGPIADARAAQGELDQAAKEDPTRVLTAQQDALAVPKRSGVLLSR